MLKLFGMHRRSQDFCCGGALTGVVKTGDEKYEVPVLTFVTSLSLLSPDILTTICIKRTNWYELPLPQMTSRPGGAPPCLRLCGDDDDYLPR